MSGNQDILGQINATTARPAGIGAPAAESPWARAFDQPTPQPGQPAPTAQNVATFGSDMLASAKAGHFAVEPGYGQQLIKGLKAEVDKLRGMERLLEILKQGTKLGTTPAALKVAPFYLEQVATTGPHAFMRNHHLGIQALENMVQAIEVAMGNYRATDDGTAGYFKHLG